MRTMATVGKRLLFTAIIVSALLSSAWGNVLAAAFCPHFNLKHVCSFKNSALQPASPEPKSHAGMCDMGMSDMPMEAADKSQADIRTQKRPADAVDDSNADADTLDQLGEPCPHCLMHSQPASRAIIVQAINPEKRSVESEVPPATSLVSLPAVFLTKPSPNEHAPPGESSRLHLLISVFRI